MSALALEAHGLSKAYKIGKTRQQVLKNVDFNGLSRPGDDGHGAFGLRQVDADRRAVRA